MLEQHDILTITDSTSRIVICSTEAAAQVAFDTGWSQFVISLPADVNQFSADRYGWLDPEALGYLQSAAYVVLALDMDEQGRRDIGPLANIIGRGNCKFAQYPNGCQSLTQLEGKLNEVDARRVLDQALWWGQPTVRKASDLPPRPMRPSHSIGIPGFEEFFRIREGDVSVWSGIPGHGKTTFLNHVMMMTAGSLEWKVCFCSFEQDTVTNHVPNMLKWYMNTPDPHLARAERRQVALDFVDEHFVFVDPQTDEQFETLTLEWVQECINKAVREHQCQVFVLDPWNEIEHDKPGHLTMHDYIGLALRKLKRIARSLNVHIAIVAHPTKLKADDGAPGMYQISDSSHWANKPDQVLIVHRPAGDEHVEVYVKKCRFQELGKVGKADFMFSPHNNRYQICEPTENSREADEG